MTFFVITAVAVSIAVVIVVGCAAAVLVTSIAYVKWRSMEAGAQCAESHVKHEAVCVKKN